MDNRTISGPGIALYVLVIGFFGANYGRYYHKMKETAST
jgi:hypothetical protein